MMVLQGVTVGAGLAGLIRRAFVHFDAKIDRAHAAITENIKAVDDRAERRAEAHRAALDSYRARRVVLGRSASRRHLSVARGTLQSVVEGSVGRHEMKRVTVGLMLVLMLAVGTSAGAQEELDSQLGAVAERFGGVVDQYDRVLEQLGFPGGLDAWWDLDSDAVEALVASIAERLEARTPGRGSALVEFLIGIDRLLEIRESISRTLPSLMNKLQQWLSNGGDEATIRSIRIEVLHVQAVLDEIHAKLRYLQSVLARIESELATL